jgi:hypothetical protein
MNEGEQAHVGVLVVDAQAALHRHRDADRLTHGRDAVGHQSRFAHQAGAEPAGLHPVGRAADVDIDFVVAEVRPDLGRGSEVGGIGAAQL